MMVASDIVIGGYSETKLSFQSGRSAYDHAGEALALLLERTGIAKTEIDGLSATIPLSESANPFFPIFMCDALGLSPSWLTAGAIGGCSILGGVAAASAAIQAGRCKIAVVLSADSPSTRWKQAYGAYRSEFQDPIGIQAPPTIFGLLMSRYRHQFGLKEQALGKLAIVQREHAMLNPNALDKFKKPLTMEEYLASRVIADPLRILDCVMFCDGANAFIVTSREEAQARGLDSLVRIAGYAECTNFRGNEASVDITEPGFFKIAPQLYSETGRSLEDVTHFQPYDDFTIAMLLQMEAFGFCERGQGSDYILDTDFSWQGPRPLNTGGGQISAGQPGLAGGGIQLAEAVRQMRGEGGDRQIRDPSVALVTGIGGIPYGRNWSANAAMILEL